jgi:hypothetical protein
VPEGPDPLASLGRVLAALVAVAIGASLAFLPLPNWSGTDVNAAPTPASSAVSEASTSPPGRPASTASARPVADEASAVPPARSSALIGPATTADVEMLDRMRDLLVSRAHDLINRHSDFYVVLAGIKLTGLEVQMLLAEPTVAEPATELQRLQSHIAAGDFTFYGWAATMHAPSMSRPDRLYVETHSLTGHVRRSTVGIYRTSAGKYELFQPVPLSYRPANVEAVARTLEAPRVTVSPRPQGAPPTWFWGALPSANRIPSPSAASPETPR